jgi:hypothetical protein
MHDLAQAIVPATSIPLGVEINRHGPFGPAFRFSAIKLYLTSPTFHPGDIGCLSQFSFSPSHHATELAGPMIGPSHSIGCRLSEILSDPARPTSAPSSLPRIASQSNIVIQCQGRDSFRDDLVFLPRPYKRRAECYRDSTASHIPSPGIDNVFCSFTALPSNFPRVSVSAGKKLTTATHHPLGRIPQLQALGALS